MTKTTSPRSKGRPWAPFWAPPVSLNGPLGGPRAPQKTTRNPQGGPWVPQGPPRSAEKRVADAPGSDLLISGCFMENTIKTIQIEASGYQDGAQTEKVNGSRPFWEPRGGPRGGRGPTPLRFGPLRFGRPCRPIRQFLEFFPGALLGPPCGENTHKTNGFL